MAVDTKKMSGLEKASILLMALGEDLAADVMKHLSPTEVQKLGASMAGVDELTTEKMSIVVGEFVENTKDKIAFAGGDDYIKNVLTKAIGTEKANTIMERIGQGAETGGIDALRWMDPKLVADILRLEHPQIIALTLAHLEPEQASEVIGYFPQRLRSDVLLRVATMENIAPGAMKELEDVLKTQLSGSATSSMRSRYVGGTKMAAEILNHLDTAAESATMADIEKFNIDLATEIQNQMFVFADLIKVDDRGLQMVLREVSSEHLVLALKGTDDTLKEKFFKNMSERAADMLKEDLESKGPVKLSDVEKAQQEIVRIARKLAEEGKIVIGGAGEEIVV